LSVGSLVFVTSLGRVSDLIGALFIVEGLCSSETNCCSSEAWLEAELLCLFSFVG